MAHDATEKYSEQVTSEELRAIREGVRFSIRDGRDCMEWACPRCKAEFVQAIDRDRPIYKFDIETTEAPGDHGVIDLVCRCGVKHEGGEGKPGCGFAALLPVQPT